MGIKIKQRIRMRMSVIAAGNRKRVFDIYLVFRYN